ncbi:MAG: hypothetical protein ACRD8O_00655 [Bryobacteraceae bacterium]
MTAGFFAPMPPAPTGVADYAASLFNAMSRLGSGKLTVKLNAATCDDALYHLGNNRIHEPIYRRALDEPGVIVLHDALLQHLFLATLDQDGYVAEFVYNYGAWSESLAHDLWRSRASGLRPDFYRFPMLRRVVERSLGVIVHNRVAAQVVRDHCPEVPVAEIPHLFDAPPAPPLAGVQRFRQRLGIRPEAFLFSVFGYLRESKRLTTVLRAFRDVHNVYASTALLIAGDFASLDLPRTAGPLLAMPGVVRSGYLPESDFWLAAAATDACLNLRFPTCAETSGIGIRLMGAGKPVFVTAGEEVANFPEAACVRIDAGPAEREMLTGYMLWLRSSPLSAQAIGQAAAEHVRRDHSLDRVAALYWETLGKWQCAPHQNRP